MPETKTSKVIAFINQQDWHNALKIVKTFRLGMTKEQKNDIITAWECIQNPVFYRQLGKNIEECIEKGIKEIKILYAVE